MKDYLYLGIYILDILFFLNNVINCSVYTNNLFCLGNINQNLNKNQF